MRGFHRLPKLETLILLGCVIFHVCKTIEGLESLSHLDLRWCNKLWKVFTDKKYGSQLETLKAIFICREIPEKQLLFLPTSLKDVYLGNYNLEIYNDTRVVFHAQSFSYLSLVGNPHKSDPFTALRALKTLTITDCPRLKRIECIPITGKELHINWCTSVKKITFQSGRYSLKKFGYKGCFKLSEIQGLFKLVSISELDEVDLGYMKWIKEYQDHKVDLDGDVITEGRIWHIQMLYEYGIRSTFLPGIKDQSMMNTSWYTTSSGFLSFNVHVSPEERRIQGLNVTALYRSSGMDKDTWYLLVKISNKTKGLTWIYNPVVFGKPRVDEHLVWLSYWPIGHILDTGDVVDVSIILEEGLVVSGCGTSLVYMDDDDCEVELENNLESNAKGEEVSGGDLSEFEVTTGGYYLCRRDLFESKTSYFLKKLFNDTALYPESQGWKKSRQLFNLVSLDVKANYTDSCVKRTCVLGVSFNSESEIDKIEKAVYSIEGVKSVKIHEETGRLIVTGHVDPVKVETCVREFEKMVKVLYIDPA